MAEIKTRPTTASVAKYLAANEDAQLRADGAALVAMLSALAKEPPVMWGEHIIGFGHLTLAGSGGRTVEWMRIACAVRAKRLTVYVTGGLDPHKDLLARLGPYQRGGGCLHIRRLADIDRKVLEQLARESLRVADSHAVTTRPAPAGKPKPAAKKKPAAKRAPAKPAAKRKPAAKKR